MSSILDRKTVTVDMNSYSSSIGSYSSLDDNSLSKEALIDKMQIKFGQLLKENQELYSIKMQNQNLKETVEKLQKELELTKQSLNEVLSQKESEKQRYEGIIAELQARIRQLEEKNDEILQDNDRLKDTIHTEREFSISEIQNQKNKVKDTYSSKIAMKDQQINELKSIIKDISDESSNSASALQAKVEESRKLKKIKAELENQIQAQTKTIAELNQQLSAAKNEILNKDQDIKSTNEKLTDLQNNFSKSEEIIKTQVDEIKTLEMNIAAHQNGIQKISSLLPSSKTADDCVIAINQCLDENKQLKYDVNVATQRLKKAADVIRQNQETIDNLSRDIESERMKNIHLKKVIEENESKNERLINQVKAYTQIRSVTHSLEQAFSALSSQFESLQEELGRPKITLKSLINTTILIKRWNLLLGTDQYYVSDQRNWWWLDSSMYHTTSYNLIKNHISKVADDKKAVIDENNELKELIRSTLSGINDAENAIIKLSNEKEELLQKLSKYDEMKDSLNEQLNGMKYIDVIQLTKDNESALSEIQSLKIKITNMTKTIEEIKQSKSESEQKATSEVVARKRYQKENEYLRSQIEILTAKVLSYEKCGTAKDKEILALERENKLVNDTCKDAVRQGVVVIKHNQKLSNRVTKQKNELRQIEKEKRELMESDKPENAAKST